MISKLVIPALLPVLMQAAVIRGSVVEHVTGKPLSRTTVALQPIAGTPGTAISRRTDRLGGFEFQGLAGGVYVVTFARPGFAALEYGQKKWNSAGYPIFLEEPGTPFLQVRLQRLGAISGTVFDEEEIGLPDHEVAVYRNTRPPEFLARTKADERGIYRFGGLMPGWYMVRTVGKHYEEGDYVPTFHRESREVSDAQAVEVFLDEQANNVNLKPHAGKLVTIQSAVLGETDETVITVVSDMGRIEQKGAAFRFEHMPPGRYEIYARLPGAYADLAAINPVNSAILQPKDASANFIFYGGRPNEVQILARRRDLAGTSPPIRFPVGATVATLEPGRWEFMALTPPDLYVSGVQANRPRNFRERPDGWTEVLVDRPMAIRYILSDKVASIGGVVTTAGKEPVVGAPVFLEGWDSIERRRMIDLREVRTDSRGRYQFSGIPPGEYRILSTFEYRAPDSASMDAAGAKEIKVVAAQSLALDLDLYVIR